MGPDGILRRCVMEEEIPRVLKESHKGLARGHMGPDTTTRYSRQDSGGQG